MKTYLFLLIVAFSCSFFAVAQTESYQWDNVAVGGGGYITGAYIHPNDPNLIYCRTDVGGMYIWDAVNQRLQPLLDWVSYENSNLYGVNGIALDPTNTDVVYASLGKYLNTTPSDVFKSLDKGKTWQPLGLNKSFAGNTHPCRQGHTLMYNADTKVLFAGTPINGLWKYNGTNWSQVSGIPTNQSVRSIAIDKNNSNFMYVATSYSVIYGTTYGSNASSGIYRSNDGGNTFTIIPIAYGNNVQFTELSLSLNGDKLYVSCFDHDNKSGGVFRIDNPQTSTTWTNISPVSTNYRAVTASPFDNNIVITAVGAYGNISSVYYSTTSGSSWTRKNSYKVTNIVSWHPSGYPGSAISCLIFDPVNPKRIYFGDWYSFYKTDDITASTVNWTNSMAFGHEEIVPAIVKGAHPTNASNALLYIGGADISGICQTDIRKYSTIPNFSSQYSALKEMSGVDYSELDGNYVVIIGGGDNNNGWAMSTGAVGVSVNGGKNISPAVGFNSAWGGGRVAVSATNKNVFVVLTNSGGVKYSTNFGLTFGSSTGVSGTYGISDIFNTTHPLASDRVNGNFYLLNKSNGDFLRSTTNGESFTKVGNIGSSSSGRCNVVCAPEKEGNIWVSNENGLYYSTNSGLNWTKIIFFSKALMVTIGKAKAGANYPTVYTMARSTSDSQYWFYKSTDGGVSWQRINTEPKAGNASMCMGADQAVYGRFYVGTNGRGVYCAQLTEETNTSVYDTHTANHEIEVYPNPISDIVNIKFPTDVLNIKFNIYQTAGKLVFSKTTNSVNGNVSFRTVLKSGTYIMEVVCDDARKLFKLVIV